MSQTAKLVGAIILVVIAIALAVWSGLHAFRPQGREVGKLPGSAPLKETEMGKIAPPPAPQGTQTR